MKKPAGSNHGSCLAQFEVVPRPGALFRVLGERAGVQAQPLRLVLAGAEDAQRRPSREAGRLERVTQGPAHLPQGTEPLEAGRPGEPGRRGQVPVRPEPDPVPARLGDQLAHQGQAQPVPAVERVDDQFAADVLIGVPG